MDKEVLALILDGLKISFGKDYEDYISFGYEAYIETVNPTPYAIAVRAKWKYYEFIREARNTRPLKVANVFSFTLCRPAKKIRIIDGTANLDGIPEGSSLTTAIELSIPSKSFEEGTDLLIDVALFSSSLCPTEAAILQLKNEGFGNKKVAAKLKTSASYVSVAYDRIKKKWRAFYGE